MTLRAITFDFWNTLFQNDGIEGRKAYRAQALSAATGVSQAQAEAAMDDVYAEFMRCHIHEQRTLGPTDGARLALQALAAPLSQDAVDTLADAFAAAIQHFPPALVDGAAAAVARAAALCPVGLVCDSGISPGRALRPILESHGLAGHFRVLSFSDEVGVAKPQAPIFTHAAAGLGVPAHALLHLGDLEATDIVGIHGVGGHGVLFAGVNARYRAGTTARDVLDDWRGFDALLDRLVRAGNFSGG